MIIEDGYKFVLDTNTGYYRCSKLRQRYHQYVWEKANNKKISKGYCIHHKDHNKANNNICNLELLSNKEHRQIHSEEMSEEHKSKMKAHAEKIRPLTKEWHKSSEGHMWHKEHYEKNKKKLYAKEEKNCRQCNQLFLGYKGNSNLFCCNKCKSKWRRAAGLDNETRKCIICNSEFITNKYSKAKTCSKYCSGKMRGQSKNE